MWTLSTEMTYQYTHAEFTISYPTITLTLTCESTISYPIIGIRHFFNIRTHSVVVYGIVDSRGSVSLILNYLGCSSQQSIIAQVLLPNPNLAFIISYLTVTITLTIESTISCTIIGLRKVLKFETLHCVRTSGLYVVVLGLVINFSDVHRNSHTLFHSWWNSNSLYCTSM